MPPMHHLIAHTIDGVLEALDGIIEQAIASENRLGYFAALYRKVTAKVKEGIATGFFEDGPRMERLDVIFANRYLAALDRWEREREPTQAWRVAFEAADDWQPLVLQQLLVGINAHINLDLGIAAAETSVGGDLSALKTDFDRINEILFSLVGQVEKEIAGISPWIAWLERIGGRVDDEIVRFSMGIARREAWEFATELARLEQNRWPPLIELRDRETTLLGRHILSPGVFLSLGLFLIRLRESNDVAGNIRALGGMEEIRLEQVEERLQARDRAAGGEEPR